MVDLEAEEWAMAVKKKRIRNKSTGRNYRLEYDNYQGSAEQIAKRSSRNKARRAAVKAGKSVNGRDVAHKNNNPKDNKVSNLAVQSSSKNRSFARTKTAGMKNKIRKKNNA